MFLLSHYQAEALLAARKAGDETAEVSLDLGLTKDRVHLYDTGAGFPDGQRLAWDDLEYIRKNDSAAFSVENDKAEKIHFFSAAFQRFYSLRPTHGAPTMLLAGFPMHRFKEVDPREDTLRKIRTIAPMVGSVLDTATGLGYTAIEAAKTADRVVTIEIDPTGLQVARMNPWSRPLFDNPRIEQKIGSAVDIVPEFRDEEFQRIIHDPPSFKLAGDLYSGVFYRELYRVLHPKGRLFHYIGDPESQHGRVVTKGVVRRLQDAGFAQVIRHPEAYGVVAVKQRLRR